MENTRLGEMALVAMPRYTLAIERAFDGVGPLSQPNPLFAAAINASVPGAACASYWGAVQGLEIYNYTICPADGTLWRAAASSASCDERADADPPRPFAERSSWLDELVGVRATWVRVPGGAPRRVATSHFVSGERCSHGDQPVVVRIHHYCKLPVEGTVSTEGKSEPEVSALSVGRAARFSVGGDTAELPPRWDGPNPRGGVELSVLLDCQLEVRVHVPRSRS